MCGYGITQTNVKSQSHATRMEESKAAILYFETKGMLGTKAVKRYVVLDEKT